MSFYLPSKSICGCFMLKQNFKIFQQIFLINSDYSRKCVIALRLQSDHKNELGPADKCVFRFKCEFIRKETFLLSHSSELCSALKL